MGGVAQGIIPISRRVPATAPSDALVLSRAEFQAARFCRRFLRSHHLVEVPC